MSHPIAQTSLSTRTRLGLRGIGAQNILSDVFPETASDAAAVGFVLAHIARDGGPVLWVQDRLSWKETGVPFVPGIGSGVGPGVGSGVRSGRPVLRVTVNRAVDVLSALEDGLRSKGLSAVIGEIWGDPPALNFTATKRLAMRAEANGLPCWLIRRAASADLSAARNRWRIASLPSARNPDDARAPGLPRWRVELFRSRQSQPGTWVASYDGAADRVDFSAAFSDGALAADDGARPERAARRSADGSGQRRPARASGA